MAFDVTDSIPSRRHCISTQDIFVVVPYLCAVELLLMHTYATKRVVITERQPAQKSRQPPLKRKNSTEQTNPKTLATSHHTSTKFPHHILATLSPFHKKYTTMYKV